MSVVFLLAPVQGSPKFQFQDRSVTVLSGHRMSESSGKKEAELCEDESTTTRI